MRCRFHVFLLLGAAGACLAFAGADDAAAQRGCTREYLPVCGLDAKGVRTTHPNACVARQAGARILHPGQCPGPFCTLVYAPVCARSQDGGPRTYPSLCEASNANATFIRQGAC